MIDALITNSLKAENIKWLERLPFEMMDKLTADAVKWILAYTKKYGHPPTTERYADSPHAMIANISFPKVPLEDLFDQSVSMLKREFTAMKLNEWRDRIDSSEELTQSELAAFARSISIPNSKDEGNIDSMTTWEWDDRPSDGITLGIKNLDEIIGGFDNETFGVIAGRPGEGKTQFLCHFANHWYHQGKRVLFVSAEMQIRMIVARIQGIMAKRNPKVLLSGKTDERDLAVAEVERQNRHLKSMGGMLGFLNTPVSISEVIHQTEKHKFDFVIVDSFYKMSSPDNSEQEWNRVKSLVNQLRQLTAMNSCSVFISSQLKRTGKIANFDLEDLAFSDAIGQDVDLAFAIYVPSKDTHVIEIIKNRYGSSFGNVSMQYDWSSSSILETSWT